MKNYDCYKQPATQNYNIVFSEYTPISAWGYVGYQILYAIPLIGWIIWLCHALSPNASSRRSYARSFFCAFLLGLILSVVLIAAGYALIMVGFGGIEGLQSFLEAYGINLNLPTA